MSSLRNIEAINQMVQGDHKFQTRTTFGPIDVEAAKQKVLSEKKRIEEATAQRQLKREIGESWIEVDPITNKQVQITQMKGYRKKDPVPASRPNKYDYLFTKCYPTCEKKIKSLYNYVDHKVGKKTSMCLDCLTKYETSLRLQGGEVFEKYALDKMKNNAVSFFRDADDEVEDFKEQLRNPPSLVFVDGRTEDLHVPDMTGMVEDIEQKYKDFKEKILTNLDHDNFKARKLQQLASDTSD